MKKNLYKNKYNKGHANRQAGMTLVELMVVLAIFLIVAGLTIFDYGRFRSSVSLQNLSDDVALSIRRAQNYAIGVRNSSSSFANGYGIHFNTALPVSGDARAGSSKRFIIFNDLNANKRYDYPGSSSALCNATTLQDGDECIDMLNITTDDIIYQICPNGLNCGSGNVCITFIRPNPDATICINGDCSSYSNVGIVVKNNQTGNTKTISVSSIGQISIE